MRKWVNKQVNTLNRQDALASFGEGTHVQTEELMAYFCHCVSWLVSQSVDVRKEMFCKVEPRGETHRADITERLTG